MEALLAIVIVIFFGTLIYIAEAFEHNIRAKSYKRGAVATDHTICSKIGVDILKRNGSAVDSYIATSLCGGIVNPMSSGIGGGGFTIVYDRQKRKHNVYDYRETAPLAMDNEDFFKGSYMDSEMGPLSIAVPSQIKGFWKMHQQHGVLPWKDLFEPAIKLAEEGTRVTKSVFGAIKHAYGILRKEKSNVYRGLKLLLLKPDGNYLRENDTMKNKELAETFREIQQKNVTGFYEGDLAKQLISELTADGGIITLKDMKNYEVKMREELQLQLPGELTLTTTPAPGSGPCLALIMNIMSGYNFSHLDIANNLDDAEQFYHTYIEALKFSLAERGLLADPDFGNLKPLLNELNRYVTNLTVGEELRKKIKINETHGPQYYGKNWAKESHGTSHTSILAENGDAVSGTNTINVLFGSLYRSPSTGIIYNNVINDFAIKGYENLQGAPSSIRNFIAPGKRSASSTTPTIITDVNDDVKMVVGASGGVKIMMGVSQVILKVFSLNMKLGDAISSYRLYHSGAPMNSIEEYDLLKIPNSLRERLIKIGHKVKTLWRKDVVQCVLRNGTEILAISDPRKQADAYGY